jgi:uncharacterized repeat protein (TIGR01451 family)
VTANLRTLIEEERELSMNRDLMPATTLTTLKKIAFTLLCCTVLMVVAAPAQTIQSIKADPGTNNPPPSGPILDLNGTPIPGTYQLYTVNFTASFSNTAITFAFRDDPSFISFANASVMDLAGSSNLLTNGDFSGGVHTEGNNTFVPDGWTYANTFGATFGGVVGPLSPGSTCQTASFCWYDGAVQAYDAISQTIPTIVGHVYQITFSVAENSGCVGCNFSELSTNGDTVDTGGNGINVTVYAQGGLPQATQKGQPVTSNGGGLSQPFVQNNAANNHVEFDFDFSTAFNAHNLTFPNGDVTPFVGFTGINQAQWQALVAGTALADTSCLTANGLTDSSNNPLCVVNSLTATTSSESAPSGKNLPQSAARDILLTQVLDLNPNQGSLVSSGQLNIPANTAPGMAEFNDSGTCPFADDDPIHGQLCPRSIMTSIIDGPTKPGGTPKPAGSSQVFFCCEREWTTVSVVHHFDGSVTPLWTNTTSVPVSFTSTPPAAVPTNGFRAAPGLGVLFGAVKHGDVLDPVFPNFNSQQTALPLTPQCPSIPDWSTAVASPFSSSGSLTQSVDRSGNVTPLAEGAYDLLYAMQDCDQFIALKYPGSINVSGAEIGGNLAAWPSVPFNIDTTKPTVSPITLNPPGGFYAPGTTVTASMTCQDPTSNNLASGIASCGGTAAPLINGTGPGSFTTNTAFVTPSTTGPQTFTFAAGATDVAGNSSSPPSPVPYQVVGNADLAIAMFGNFLVKTGQNLTYFILLANRGPNTADIVVVHDTLPANTTFVSAGFAIDSCTLGNGSPSCSILPPTNSCGSIQGSCSIGVLPAWTKNNPIGAIVQITVKVNANANTTIKNTATVGEANNDPISRNNTASWQTFVIR